MGKLAKCVAVTLAAMTVLAGGVSTAVATEEEPVNPTLNVNPNGDTGLEGWTSTGWAVVAYGSSPNVPPRFGEPGFLGPPNLFQAQTAGSTMTQDVSFARYDAQIETGTGSIAISASLGSAGSNNNGAEILAQPEDAEGNPLGPPTQLGPPTAADREDKTTLIECMVQFTAPVRTRSVLITLQATGTPGEPSTAMASGIFVSNILIVPLVLHFGEMPAQGQHCRIVRPPTTWPPLTTEVPADPHQSNPPNTVTPHNYRQKLTKALAACKKMHNTKRRHACASAAKKRYSPPRRKTKADGSRSESAVP
jgi:hypothetical protein